MNHLRAYEVSFHAQRAIHAAIACVYRKMHTPGSKVSSSERPSLIRTRAFFPEIFFLVAKALLALNLDRDLLGSRKRAFIHIYATRFSRLITCAEYEAPRALSCIVLAKGARFVFSLMSFIYLAYIQKNKRCIFFYECSNVISYDSTNQFIHRAVIKVRHFERHNSRVFCYDIKLFFLRTKNCQN